jgi:hypothetical protein
LSGASYFVQYKIEKFYGEFNLWPTSWTAYPGQSDTTFTEVDVNIKINYRQEMTRLIDKTG